jgi:hypothetical protein
MLEFTELLEHAKRMSKKLGPTVGSVGCIGFFSAVIPQYINYRACEDAFAIGLFADSLSKVFDEELKSYLTKRLESGSLTEIQFIEFKRQAIGGMYLLVWSHYNTSAGIYLNDALLRELKEGLELEDPNAMDPAIFDNCLRNLGIYCSYVFENNKKPIFNILNNSFGKSIQSDISILRNEKYQCDSSISSVYSGIIRSLGY